VTQSPLFGDDRPDDLNLGSTQREVVRALRAARGPLSRAEIGGIVHEQRDLHPRAETCRWCGVDADLLIGALTRRGIVERAPEGDVTLR
jgi:hypothetical protein